jgi:hypothetical protein
MERKTIDIQGMNMNTGPWIHTRPAKQFRIIEHNGVTFAVTENNYFLDTKKDKIRFQFMKCDQCSWKHSYHIYMEVFPGLFAFCSSAIDTDDGLNIALERYSKIYHDNNYPDNPDVEEFRKQLTRKN